MGRIDVRRMLSEITSREWAMWRAYEMATGPLDQDVSNEALAAIHEQLQALNYSFGQANFADKDGKDNPIPAPTDFPRARNWHRRPQDDDGSDS